MFALLTSLAFAVDLDRTVPISGDTRSVPVARVLLHATGGPACDPRATFRGGSLDSMVDLFQTRTDGVSIHYIVGEDGRIVAMVPEDEVASHAKGRNQDSVGIEIVNDGDGKDPYPAAQVEAVTALVTDILARHQLAADAVTTHDAVDTRYYECDRKGVQVVNDVQRGSKLKVDPGPAFPFDAVKDDVGRRVSER